VIKLTDVTLRDGLQSDPVSLSTQQKLEVFEALQACHYNRLEITSFSHPKWIPQLADSDSFCEELFKLRKDFATELMAFVPNERGLERLLKFPIPWVSLFIAASESFNQKNINCPRQQTLNELRALIQKAHANQRKVRVYISTAFGCPYEGAVSEDTVQDLTEKVLGLSPDEIALSDTIGVANPIQVKSILGKIAPKCALDRIALHFHDTYGLALSNIVAGIEMGITRFDGATGGIGGCPYAKGASGNVATEAIAYLLNRLGHKNQVHWGSIKNTLQLLRQLGLQVESKLAAVEARGGNLYGIQ